MSIVKTKLIALKNKVVLATSRAKKAGVARWRALNPGFRYALMYFVSVVCIASVVWWQFNPGSGLVFDPTGNGDPPPTVHEPHPDQDPPQEPGQQEPPIRDEVNGIPGPNGIVFQPERDKLSLPLPGELLTGFGEPFEWSPGIYRGGLDGVHIDGTRGDPVHLAWQGVVEAVIHPEHNGPGEVRVKHGDWVTIYRNLTEITVIKNQTVDIRHKIGELAGKIVGVYTGDYLEFEVWGPDGTPHDPQDYLGDAR